MQYLKSFFVSEYDDGFEKYKKTPVLLNIKDSKKTLLSYSYLNPANNIEYDKEPNFAVFTGKINNIILIDFDINKTKSTGEKKLGGIEWFEKKYGPILDNFGLVTETPSGGIHAYCKYTDKLEKSSIGFFHNENNVSIDVLSNEGVGFQGRGYTVIKNEELEEIPKEFLKLLTSLEYVPLNIRDLQKYSIVNTLTERVNYPTDFKCIQIPDIIGKYLLSPPLKIVFLTSKNDSSEQRSDGRLEKDKLVVSLDDSDDFKEKLDSYDNDICSYLVANSENIYGRKRTIDQLGYNKIVHTRSKSIPNTDEYANSTITIKLPFSNGMPLFNVYDEEGCSLNWIDHKNISKNPVLNWSWTDNKIKLKIEFEGLWKTNAGIFPTFKLREVRLV
jgi:hypothetical protein